MSDEETPELGGRPLAGIRVIEAAGQIAGPYCGKLLADAGAEVIKLEPGAGDPLRARPALFAHLNAGKRSLALDAGDPAARAWLAGSDVVLHAHGLEGDPQVALDVAALRAAAPHVVVVSITPYGTTGPWAGRGATEFTLQAECGGLGCRGLLGGEPFQAGGRVTEWAAGVYAAAAGLAALLRAQAGGPGAHVDLSLLEVANMIFTNYSETINRLMNGSPDDPEHMFLAPVIDIPSIEPTADGFVGFTTNATAQFRAFCELIERPELANDERFSSFAGRLMHYEEWTSVVHAWTQARTTDEVVARAGELRVPVAPVGNGATVLGFEQLQARGVFRPDASGAFLAPRPPYRIDDADPVEPASPPAAPASSAAPSDASSDGTVPTAASERRAASPLATATPAPVDPLPLAGLRVLDLTAWWAGPAATHFLACLGAEVVHVESARRPDGLRALGAMLAFNYDRPHEASPHFLHTNANKLGVVCELDDPADAARVDRLISWADVVVENFTPRVLEQYGITWERIQRRNPGAVFVRMPAFGLSGPWRDRPGFAQTVEQLSGLAWVTGHPDDQPRVPRGPCDPVAGVQAAFGALVGLAARRRSGHGHHVECTMAETALNLAAEQVIEWTANGRLLSRAGNRSDLAAPQGLYRVADAPNGAARWLALAVATDEQWQALVGELGLAGPAGPAGPAGALGDGELDRAEGRRAHADEIDAALREVLGACDPDGVASRLRARGVLASVLVEPGRVLQSNPQLQARGYFERPEHAVVGRMPIPSLPFRMSGVDAWIRTPAPLLGEHDEAVFDTLVPR